MTIRTSKSVCPLLAKLYSSIVPENSTELSLRELYVISYADYLRSDPGLWRITTAYLCCCGHIGQKMADEVLTHVPLTPTMAINWKPSEDGQASAKQEIEQIKSVLDDLTAACEEHQRYGAEFIIFEVYMASVISRITS